MKTSALKLFLLVCLFTLGASMAEAKGKQAKYIFYLISDGTGVNTFLGAEMMRAELNGSIGYVPFVASQFPVRGLATTYSADKGITDSAASGTALATGNKTKNGMIGENPDSADVTSIAQWAKDAGARVGVATSVCMNHATPASFYAHEHSRNNYFNIGVDMIESGFDFYGASDFHKPNGNNTNLYAISEKGGYTIARGIDDYNKKVKDSKKMILFQTQECSDIDSYSLPYYIDAKPGQMTVAQMMKAQLDFLYDNSKNGFLLVNEIGGKVDFACHANDAATAFKELEIVDSCVAIAFEFYKNHPDETLIVLTSDHETGGLVLATRKGGSALNLKVLANQKCSQDNLTRAMQALRSKTNNKVEWEQIKELLSSQLGFWGEVKLSKQDEDKLKAVYNNSFVGKMPNEKNLYSSSEPMAAEAIRIINAKANISWSTGGHSAGFVPVYACGVGAEEFAGLNDNATIPLKIAKIAGYKK